VKLPIDKQNAESHNEIAFLIQFSCWYVPIGGIHKSIEIFQLSEIILKRKMENNFLVLLRIVMITFGLYHLILDLQRRKEV
jgi:hypothetical protein